MEILTSEQMSLADKITIEELNTPSIVLMENAARASAEYIKSFGLCKERIAIVVGPGNNGGDGLAIARHLYNFGIDVEIFLIEPVEKFTPDAKVNYEIIKNYPIKIADFSTFHDNYDIIIDAIFGTGLNRPVEGKYLNIITTINNSRAKKISIDIPSGLSGSKPYPIGECIKADWTITFCRPKISHCIYPARSYCGSVKVLDISIPDFILPKVGPYIFLMEKKNLPKIPKRNPSSHKGNYGHTVFLGGSDGKSGAITISTFAAIKTGSGLTTSIVPKYVSSVLTSFVPEAMTLPIDDYDMLDDNNIEEIITFLADKSVLAIGPGMGVSNGAKKLLQNILAQTAIKLVIDADGINNLNDIPLEKLRYRTIITPHIGEFARLLSISKNELLKDIIEKTRRFAIANGIIVVLKSSSTIIADVDGNIYVYKGGIPALAKGGSGDCLTGIIASFVSQSFSLIDAAKLGVYIFGETGRILAAEMNELTITATDIIKNIHKTINEIQYQ
ncbi:MAG: NAD(P)H-hydrate dehydratase [Calditerrivibrio sp.]|nr:NAD(P)H-hydrate dehydratase [Calditerrivibrio sp.]